MATYIPMNSINRSSVWCNIITRYKQTCCPLDIFPCPISWEVRSQHQVYCWELLFELQVQAVSRAPCVDRWQEPHTSCDYYLYPWNTHWHVSNIPLFLFPVNFNDTGIIPAFAWRKITILSSNSWSLGQQFTRDLLNKK